MYISNLVFIYFKISVQNQPIGIDLVVRPGNESACYTGTCSFSIAEKVNAKYITVVDEGIELGSDRKNLKTGRDWN